MPADPAAELAPLLAGAWPLFAAALLAALGAALGLKLAGRPFAPRFRPAPAGWWGIDAPALYLGWALASAALVGRLGPEGVNLAALIASSAAAAAAFGARAARNPAAGRVPSGAECLRAAGAGAAGFLVLAPITFAVFWAALDLTLRAGGGVTRHPVDLGGVGPGFGARFALVAATCVAVPLWEEAVFRGILMRYALARAPQAAALVGVALILGLARCPAGAEAGVVLLWAPAAGLVALLPWLRANAWRRLPVRHCRAVLATSLVFAELHAFAWPSPWPLFVLACGLGCLALRFRSVLAPALAHGLFNLVSVLGILQAH